MNSDCYEKGHTAVPRNLGWWCTKCGEPLLKARVSETQWAWHTQAELDRLWQGVDREAVGGMSDE